MMRPAQADPAAVAAIGSAMFQAGQATGEGDDGAAVYLALFRQGGAWDYQRVGPDNATKIEKFVDFANVEVGVYAASIGMSLDTVLTISDRYAMIFSKFPADANMDPVYTHLPHANVQDEAIGYNLYNAGLIGHH